MLILARKLQAGTLGSIQNVFFKVGRYRGLEPEFCPREVAWMNCGLEEGGGLIFSRKLKGQENTNCVRAKWRGCYFIGICWPEALPYSLSGEKMHLYFWGSRVSHQEERSAWRVLWPLSNRAPWKGMKTFSRKKVEAWDDLAFRWRQKIENICQDERNLWETGSTDSLLKSLRTPHRTESAFNY